MLKYAYTMNNKNGGVSITLKYLYSIKIRQILKAHKRLFFLI